MPKESKQKKDSIIERTGSASNVGNSKAKKNELNYSAAI